MNKSLLVEKGQVWKRFSITREVLNAWRISQWLEVIFKYGQKRCSGFIRRAFLPVLQLWQRALSALEESPFLSWGKLFPWVEDSSFLAFRESSYLENSSRLPTHSFISSCYWIASSTSLSLSRVCWTKILSRWGTRAGMRLSFPQDPRFQFRNSKRAAMLFKIMVSDQHLIHPLKSSFKDIKDGF